MIDFTEWVIRNTVYPDVTYHDFLREQSANHDRILEVGVHIGSSFIGMLRDRETTVATGIDAFIQTTKDELILDFPDEIIMDKYSLEKKLTSWRH